MRLFLAFALPFAQSRAVAGLRRDRAGWRWVAEENLHLTLAFLGDVTHDQARALDEALLTRSISPPPITLKGIGHFGAQKPRAVWIGAEPLEPLAALSARLTRAARGAGITVERRRFVPHVTIARMNAAASPSDVARFAEDNAKFTLPPFTPTGVTLFRSHLRPEGPIYEPLADYPDGLP